MYNHHLIQGILLVVYSATYKKHDCVNHEILLAKMKFYGISGIANKLMESYIGNRYQRISVNNSKHNKLSSKWVRVKHGVP